MNAFVIMGFLIFRDNLLARLAIIHGYYYLYLISTINIKAKHAKLLIQIV